MTKSFKYALQGIIDALKSEPNLSVHFLFALLVLIFAYFFEFSKQEVAILILTIFFVITFEMINTAIEKLVDLHSLEKTELARQIKDISAAVVLFASITSIIIAGLLFIPKII
jgi:diacylglycerol kinase